MYTEKIDIDLSKSKNKKIIKQVQKNPVYSP